ncbi:hypothetical protein OC834_003032 [Tilletia horrida]|nr:hypothetical protein OC834_003032 [Tilletia horrida]
MASSGSAGSNSNAAIPPVLSGWLRARYPTLQIRQEWLEGCVEYIVGSNSSPGRRLTDRELIKQVNIQLLHSDLADSAEAGTLSPDILTAHKQRIGEKGRGVLLQVVGIMDVGVSAQTQLDVLAARKEARTHPPAPGAGAAPHAGAAEATEENQEEGEEEEDHMAAFHSSESALASIANPTVYPRSVLRIHLSDGHNPDVLLPAFEHSRIEALSMNDGPTPGEGRTLLGCKVLLKGAEVRRGQVLLRPGEVEVLGGSIPELEDRAEYILTNSLRVRLGKPPEPEEMDVQ